MSIQIRQAAEKDFSSILELIKEFSHFIQTPEKVTVTLEQMKEDKDYFKCIVATEQEKVIGFASYFLHIILGPGKLYILMIYTSVKNSGAVRSEQGSLILLWV
jgi:hypothetical protein